MLEHPCWLSSGQPVVGIKLVGAEWSCSHPWQNYWRAGPSHPYCCATWLLVTRIDQTNTKKIGFFSSFCKSQYTKVGYMKHTDGQIYTLHEHSLAWKIYIVPTAFLLYQHIWETSKHFSPFGPHSVLVGASCNNNLQSPSTALQSSVHNEIWN